MACSTGIKAAVCCSILGAILVIILSIVIVVGHQAPIAVNGANAHIQEITEVRSSLIAMDNRVHFSGIGISSILVLIIVILSARAGHHCIIKKPGKMRKRIIKAQTETRLINLEELMKARGYM